MRPLTIHHIGVLVDELPTAIGRWARLSGYTFKSPVRYVPDAYRDAADLDPHPHDVLLAFSHQGPPFIELMQAVPGAGGTHAMDQLGIHHLGFEASSDLDERMEALQSSGVAITGEALDQDGRRYLWFTEKSQLDGLRLEFIRNGAQPVLTVGGDPVGNQ